MIVDSHAHLDMSGFDPDRDEVIRRAVDAGVELIVAIATGTPQGKSVEATLAIAERQDFIWAAVGVSPHDARFADEAYLRILEKHAEHPKVVLWGEIGLDYHYDLSPREVQRHVFRRQLGSALRCGLPVSIHCRDAWGDLIEILREEYPAGNGRVVLHSFTGTQEQALEAAALGYMISFSGIVTFRNADSLRAAARALPLEQIMVETDCPYLAPVPHRGKRNEPAFVVATAQALAQLRGMEYEVFARQTSENARRFLGSLADSDPKSCRPTVNPAFDADL
jgi:TatD DNase family protein